MRTQTAVVLGLFLAGTAWAVQPTPFTGFLHKSPTPQPVPGGTSTFVLSPTAPTGSPVLTEQLSVIKTQSASFPAFIAPPFTQNAVLPIVIGATVSLSANLGMGSCAQMDANILQIDPLGNETVAANVGLVAATIPQGSVNGTVGFHDLQADRAGHQLHAARRHPDPGGRIGGPAPDHDELVRRATAPSSWPTTGRRRSPRSTSPFPRMKRTSRSASPASRSAGRRS